MTQLGQKKLLAYIANSLPHVGAISRAVLLYQFNNHVITVILINDSFFCLVNPLH